MQESLTPRQSNLLAYLKRRLSEGDVAPSYQEIVNDLGLASKSSVHGLMKQLESRGRIKREAYAHRRIRIIEP